MNLRSWGVVIGLVLTAPAVAAAQGPTAPLSVEPLPWVLIDVRGAWPALGPDELSAAGVGASVADLPNRAMTGIAGAHVYPLRRGRVKVGVGAEMLVGRGRYQPKDSMGEPFGEPITRTLRQTSVQVSLNFGRGQGWSYITAGTGPMEFDSFRGEGPGDHEARRTLNAGAGGRWFNWRHLGLVADFRLYFTKAEEAGVISAARRAKRLLVLSVGATFK